MCCRVGGVLILLRVLRGLSPRWLTVWNHLLGALAGRVLKILLEADSALCVGAIAEQLGESLMAAGDPAWFAAIDEVLSEFHRLELALPVRP